MEKVLIIVSVYNRKKITELVLENLFKYKKENSSLWVYNDHSTEYDNSFLEPLCDKVFLLQESNNIVIKNEKNKKGMGIAKLRWQQLRDFINTDYDFLYFTDNDALHDPEFENILLETYKRYKTKMPISLYDTVWHKHVQNHLKEDKNVYMRRYGAGISHFYDRNMVEKILSVLDNQTETPNYGWDYQVSDYMKLPMVVTKTSYVEHFGALEDSMHTQKGDWDRDRAINPTTYLKDIRNDIIEYLENKTTKKPQI